MRKPVFPRVNWKDLKQRLLISAISIFCLIVIVALSYVAFFGFLVTAIVALVAGISLWEYFRLLRHKGFHPHLPVAVTCGVIYILTVYLAACDSQWEKLPYLVLLGSLVASFIAYFRQRQQALVHVAVTFFGICYIAVTLGCIVGILYFFPFGALFSGRWWLIYLLIVAKMTDVGGYFIGRYLGKHKLAVHLSPAKTVEGAVAGLILSTLASLCFAWAGLLPWTEALWLGALMSVVAQLGDLTESLLKRDAGVKDSNTIPGLGGVLDMVDSLLFAAPLLYLYLTWNY